MPTLTTPGVHIETVLSEPARVLRTGVPVFLGLIRMEHVLAHNARQVESDLRFVCKPILQAPGVSLVRNQGYLRLPRRVQAAASDPRISDRSSRDLSLYLKAIAPGPQAKPEARGDPPATRASAAGGQFAALAEPGADELMAMSGKPQRFTIWPRFEETYGGLKPYGFLVHAVRGFFENGGSLCYVQLVGYDDGSPDALAKAVEVGLATLAQYDDYDLVCIPDLMWIDEPAATGSSGRKDIMELQSAILAYCQQLGDRMAILDSLPGADSEIVLAQRRRLCGDNGALYYPWVRVAGGPQRTGGYVPPCGHVAGLFARCDQRVGVHKAPANEILEGVLELAMALTDDQQGPLNEQNVNCIRVFPRRGIRVWGARTLSGGSTWRYVNARRVILTAVRWIDLNLADTVFEPHTPRLWDRITRELTAYFTDLVRRGALSAPPDSPAFYVKCDAETNPQEIQEAGMIVTEIGLMPAAPAEYIVIRIIHGPAGVRIEEPGT
jgi:hypothetical protein